MKFQTSVFSNSTILLRRVLINKRERDRNRKRIEMVSGNNNTMLRIISWLVAKNNPTIDCEHGCVDSIIYYNQSYHQISHGIEKLRLKINAIMQCVAKRTISKLVGWYLDNKNKTYNHRRRPLKRLLRSWSSCDWQYSLMLGFGMFKFNRSMIIMTII